MITRKPHAPVRRAPTSVFAPMRRPWLFAGTALVSILSSSVLAAPTSSCDVGGTHYAHCGAAGAAGGDGTATAGGAGGAGYSNPDDSNSTGGAGGAVGQSGTDGSGPYGGSGGGGLGGDASGGGSDSGGGGGFGFDGYGGSGGGGGGEIGSVLSGGGSVASSLGGNGGDGGEDFNFDDPDHMSFPDRMGGPGGGGSGVWLTDDQHYTVAADGTITGGTGGGGWNAGDGGNGVTVGASGTVLDNAGTIAGGESGYGHAGLGGAGVYFVGAGTLTNMGHISGGAGPGFVEGGTGGNGVTLTHGSDTTSNQLDNKGVISGGDSSGAVEWGDGGNGVLLTHGTLDNSGAIAGGSGNSALDSRYDNGNGGDAVTGSDFSLNNTGTLTGGNAGQTADSGGSGGAGVRGEDLNVITSGQITGGLNGDGSRANAVTFTGGNNSLWLRDGSVITGIVDATAGTLDRLMLGGTADGSVVDSTFAVGQIGPSAQFRGFEQYWALGNGVMTLTGATTEVTPWTVDSDTVLSVATDASLGNASGNLLLRYGGTLQVTGAANETTARNIDVYQNGRIDIDDAGNSLTLNGNVGSYLGSSAALIKGGDGALTLAGDSNDLAGIWVEGGTLSLDGDFVPGSSVAIMLNEGTTLNNTAAIGQAKYELAPGASPVAPSQAVTVNNSGSIINSSGTLEAGVSLFNGDITNTGTISTSVANLFSGGVVLTGEGNIDNSGSISNVQGTAAFLGALPTTAVPITGPITLVNHGGGSIEGNIGVLTTQIVTLVSGTTPTYSSRPISITNEDGTIRGDLFGIVLAGGGTITNQAGSIIEATGTATGACDLLSPTASGSCAVYAVNTASLSLPAGFALPATVLTNAGSIIGNVQLSDGLANDVTLVAGGAIEGDLDMGTSTDALLTLSGDTGTTQTYSQAVTGSTTFAGQLSKSGAGTWVLDNAALAGVTGTTQLQAGSLIVGGAAGDGGALGGNVAVASGATLGGHGAIGGDVTVADGGHIAPGNSVGVLEVAGDLILNGGSMLDFELGSPGSAAAPASGVSDRIDVAGDLTLDGVLNLTQSADSADGAAGFGYYRLLTYGGDLTDNGLDISAPSTLTGPGRYEVQAGGGNVDLLITALGDDTLQHWQGGDGTWNATNVQWLNQGSSVPVAWAGNHAVFKNEPGGFSGGTIAVEGAQSFKGLQFVDGGYYLEGTGTLLTDAASNAEIRVLANATAHIATTIDGSGGITKTQGGTLVLAGANTYGGGTSITGGTLELSAGGTAGTGSISVDDGAGQGATLKVDSGASLSNLILLSNDGQLNNQGDISNSSDIAAVTTAGSAGQVVNHGGGAIDGASFGVLLFDGGSVINSGVGSEIRASGADGWAVTIGDSSGALLNADQARIEGAQVGAALGNGGVIDNRDGASIAGGQVGVMLLKGGTVSNGAGSIIETTGSAAGDCNASGDCAILVSNTGADHGGALTLVNAGRIIGNVQMDASAANTTVLVAGGVIEGDLLMGGNTASTLTLDGGNGTAQHYSDAVTGATTFAGALTKSGSGVWVIDNAGLSGATSTTVAGGALVVGGSAGDGAVLGGDVNVDAGALLGGHGTINGNVTNAGILAPGNSVGTLSVTGDITFAAGSSYLVEVDPISSDSDQVHATGTATLNGGSVVHIGENGTYRPDSSYTILTADGGITGTFADVASSFAFLDPTLVYDPNSVVLRLMRNDINFCMVGMTTNQCATGNGAESTGSGSPIYNAIAGLSADQARVAFDQLSGEIHASTQSALLADSHFVRRAMDDRLLGAAGRAASTAQAVMTYNDQGEQQLAPADADGFVVWEQAFGSWASMDGDGNAARLDHDTGGFFIGADAPLGSAWRLGAVAGYSHSSFSTDARASSTSSRNYHLGLYSGRQWGALGLRFGTAYTWHDIEASRSVSFKGFSDRPTADYHAGTAQAFGELGYTIGLGDVALEPFANLAYVNLHSDGFSEKGGDAALSVDNATSDATFTTIGSRISGDFDLAGVKMTAQGSLGWQHAMGDTTPHSRHAFNGGDDFTIAGVPIAEDAAIIEAGVGLDLAPNTTLGVAYQGQLANDARENGFKMKLDVRF